MPVPVPSQGQVVGRGQLPGDLSPGPRRRAFVLGACQRHLDLTQPSKPPEGLLSDLAVGAVHAGEVLASQTADVGVALEHVPCPVQGRSVSRSWHLPCPSVCNGGTTP